ncbi:MAG TPA: hypothetical protein VFW17_18340 [Ktedonobacterales bacterium]|jgi:hypothetical protein|nr:hypothetical protein [Ktedonobacterales bacterium]
MSTAPSGGGYPPGKMRAAVAVSTLVLFALTIPLLFVFVFGLIVQPTASAQPDVQPSPTATIQAVLTVAPDAETTPTATVKSGSGGSGGGSGGGGQPGPTATPRAAPTATTTPPMPVPTVPTGSG